uniref:Uncharacterized protein n=1 Tax=Amphimedon queenslandica TaxID=400682 RepID=A0A1X7TER7_AMPQE
YMVCVLDATVLLRAKWDTGLNEVWISIVPVEEAVKRVMKRDGADEERARQRIASKMSNREAVDHAHVVFCTLWEYEY